MAGGIRLLRADVFVAGSCCGRYFGCGGGGGGRGGRTAGRGVGRKGATAVASKSKESGLSRPPEELANDDDARRRGDGLVRTFGPGNEGVGDTTGKPMSSVAVAVVVAGAAPAPLDDFDDDDDAFETTIDASYALLRAGSETT